MATVLCPCKSQSSASHFPKHRSTQAAIFVCPSIGLLQEGKVYHSRHGEWFHLGKPEQGALFPSLDVISSPDPLHQELKALGWDLHFLTEKQKECFMTAIRLGITLTQAQTRLAMGEG